MGKLETLGRRLKEVVIGRARSVQDPELFRKLSLIAVLAWVGLGADGLSSSCYGPEAAFLALGTHLNLGIFVAAATALTIFVIAGSYSQIVEVFPSGGGGYLVASKLLSPSVGMAAGCALLIDYVLTIALSVASGTDALFSSLPVQYQKYKLLVSVAGVLVLILLNLRGVKESVVSLTPIFIVFVLAHGVAIVIALASHVPEVGALAGATRADIQTTTSEVGTFGLLFLIFRAFSMGAGTFTGIEAVSNGLPILREPKVQTAKRTLTYMSLSLAFMAAGLMVGYLIYGVQHTPGRTLNAVLLERLTQGWSGPIGPIFVTVTLLSEAILLFVAAQTGFIGAPQVLGYMSVDRWLPQQFSLLSERFVIKNGVLLTGGAALLLLILTRGSVAYMVVLYSINVFITFTLSQLGMVRHWWQKRRKERRWRRKIVVNGVGLLLTVTILIAVVLIKFQEGGWITIFVTGSLVLLALTIKRFYRRTGRDLRHLDALVTVVESSMDQHPSGSTGKHRAPRYNPRSKTAVILVSGFNGMGLHTLFNIVRLFGKGVRNFFFIQTGVIDAEKFKGKEEIARLEAHVSESLDRYVSYVSGQGFYAKGFPLVGTDIVEEICTLASKLFLQYSNSIFFGGRIVFAEETFLTRLLYNYVTSAVQRRLLQMGIPFIVIPVPVSRGMVPRLRPTLADGGGAVARPAAQVAAGQGNGHR